MCNLCVYFPLCSDVTLHFILHYPLGEVSYSSCPLWLNKKLFTQCNPSGNTAGAEDCCLWLQLYLSLTFNSKTEGHTFFFCLFVFFKPQKKKKTNSLPVFTPLYAPLTLYTHTQCSQSKESNLTTWGTMFGIYILTAICKHGKYQ